MSKSLSPRSVPLSPQGAEVNRILAAVNILSGVGILLRCYTRFWLIKRAGPDDYLILISFAFACTLTALTVQEVHAGLGVHIQDVPLPDQVKSLKALWFAILTYNLSLTFTKVSVLTQYLRIIVNKRMRTICFCMIGLVTAYGLQLFFSGVFLCYPVQGFWNKTINAKCVDELSLWYFNAGMNIATDFSIFLLPVPVIKQLNLPTRQKIGLVFVFAIGLFTCVTSVIRVFTLAQIANSKDPTFDNAKAAAWSAVEVNTGIFCACLATLKPLISQVAPGLISTVKSRSSGHPYYIKKGTMSSDGRMPSHRAPASNSQYPLHDINSIDQPRDSEGGYDVEAHKTQVAPWETPWEVNSTAAPVQPPKSSLPRFARFK